MKTDALIEVIENSTELNQMQKNVYKGFIHRADEAVDRQSADRQLIQDVYGKVSSYDIVLSNDEVKIIKLTNISGVHNGPNGKDDWDVKYPYRSIFKDRKGVWQRGNTVSPTMDLAFLTYMEKKYIGENSQFVNFAMKMLDIPMPE